MRPEWTATLTCMSEGKADVGSRIQNAAARKSLETPTRLWAAISAEAKNLNLKQTVTRQTVSNWWHGKVYPSMDTLPLLARVLGEEQEWLLFGSKRGEQLKKERQYLARISDEEAALLTTFREASKSGQKTILRQAKVVAEEQPADTATTHNMRRKDDKLKT
jgi:transcriptional regulator with XRE-family HTH domain